MNKNVFVVRLTLIMVSIATATSFLFIYPYSPTIPPLLDDSSSSSQGIQEVVNANNQFAFDLYSKLSESEGGNVFYSPYSIFSALAMTYEGAKGQTAEEMKSVFHFPENNVLRSNYAAIHNNINQERISYELRSGNALWGLKDYPFLEDYINRIGTYFGGNLTNLDFLKEPEKSRQIINNYIEELTNNKIKEIIPAGFINALTRLIITNAIYFNGSWEWKFEEYRTNDKNFTITPGNVVQTPMMHMNPGNTKFKYANLTDLQILELPYKGDKISMLILLPRENLSVIEPSLTAEKLIGYKNLMGETSLEDIYLPKFEFDSIYFMNDALISLGMPTAFGGNADFSGMTNADKLSISDVIHQGYIRVDEEGTEAAAATTVYMQVIGPIPPPKPIFNADHPFIFLIQERETGNILFLGKVTDPTTE